MLFIYGCGIFSDSQDNLRRQVERVMQNNDEQFRELFEQSREHLDILRNSAFVEKSANASYEVLTYFNNGSIRLVERKNWNLIDWMNEEIYNSLIELLTNRNFPFQDIHTRASEESSSLIVMFYEVRINRVINSGRAFFYFVYGEAWCHYWEITEPKSLGDGWYIRVDEVIGS